MPVLYDLPETLQYQFISARIYVPFTSKTLRYGVWSPREDYTPPSGEMMQILNFYMNAPFHHNMCLICLRLFGFISLGKSYIQMSSADVSFLLI